MKYKKPTQMQILVGEFIGRESVFFTVGEGRFTIQNATVPGGPTFYSVSSVDDGEFAEFKQIAPGLWHYIDQRCLSGEPPPILVELPRTTAAYTDHWTYTTRDQDNQDLNVDIDLPMALLGYLSAFAHAVAIECALVGAKEHA